MRMVLKGIIQDVELQYSSGAVIEPDVPYIQSLPKLEHGLTVLVSGFTKPNAKQFVIDLETETGDVALHVKVWFQKGLVVRNTRSASKWGQEETHGGFPLTAGSFFESCLLFHQDCFKLAFNGQFVCSYRHRLPPDSIARLHVHDDVSRLHSVLVTPTVKAGATKKKAMPALPSVPKPGSEEAKSFKMLPGGYNLHIPYSVKIPGGMFPTRVVYLSVLPKFTATRFTLNLQQGENDIALHLDARFNEQAVIRNTRSKGSWGVEEREAPTFPLRRGKHCDVLIWVTEKAYLISMNNQHFATYRHRYFELGAVNTLQVTGDVSLLHMRIR